MYALDTNTLVYFFKGLGSVGKRFLATPPQEIGIPAIVLYEIESGIRKSLQPQKRRQGLSTLMQLVKVLPFDGAAAEAAADIRLHLEKSGTPIGPLDVLIAGTAVANGAILVTHNTREFVRIPHLRMADWY